jgi:predicted cupin superfamily sugar epimerase
MRLLNRRSRRALLQLPKPLEFPGCIVKWLETPVQFTGFRSNSEATAMKPTLTEVMRLLNLKPLPEEGGFFVESYRSSESIDARQFERGHQGTRPLCTAIYYLLTPGTFSALHKLPGDEMFHFYGGDAVEMLELFPDGSGRLVTLGADISRGMELQHLVRGGVWQGSRLAPGGEYGLLGTTMAPGFDYRDFIKGNRNELMRVYPEHAEMIAALL